ncbi:helix-turn-helix domain-containing protein [Mannheimia sp. E30BD]
MKNETLTSHPIRHTFANNLRKIRRLKDISQEALAFDAELSRAYISDVE